MPISKFLIPQRACNPRSAAGSGKKNLKLLLAANKRLNTAYLLKESFGQRWDSNRETWARKFFENWRASLKWQRLKPLRNENRAMFRQVLLAIAFVVSSTCALTANAMTDCNVRLVSSFTGDMTGTGQYALFLVYNYTTTGGSVVGSWGYILLSNPAAANISAVTYAAQATGQSVQVRYLNSSGASADSVCGSTTARSDLIGIWLAT
jgi:Transposase